MATGLHTENEKENQEFVNASICSPQRQDALNAESPEKTQKRITKGSLFHNSTGVEQYNSGLFKKKPSAKKREESGYSKKAYEQEATEDPGWKEVLYNSDEWEIVGVPPAQNVDILREAYLDAAFALGGDISCLKLEKGSGEDHGEQETINADGIDSIDESREDSWAAALRTAECVSPTAAVSSHRGGFRDMSEDTGVLRFDPRNEIRTKAARPSLGGESREIGGLARPLPRGGKEEENKEETVENEVGRRKRRRKM
ncbi:hypothetical protein N7478_012868 [Penicillium angulare]|uniref:uncharacterized protein n=1 Tax=Penicillium angulare TaxID=116970 RepID=UPI0025423E21|nr:uncharacterized protein N7478_012868 [Penicillium angulare]KAJ5256764.1 hypothetical protein N7478_012868 [Penicillium angulare]